MTKIGVVLGRTQADREDAINILVPGTDSLGRSKALCLRSTRRSVHARLQQAGRRGRFGPTDRTLNDYLVDLARTQIGGRGLLSANALAFELGALAESKQHPMLQNLPLNRVEIGLHLGAIYQQWSEFLDTGPSLPDWMVGLFHEAEQRWRKEDAWTTLGMLLKDALVQPVPPAIRNVDALVVDEAQNLTPARTQLLFKSVESLAANGTQILFSIPSDRPEDLPAAYDFFSGEPGIGSPLRNEDYEAGLPFRKAILERFLLDGDPRIYWAGPDGLFDLDGLQPEASRPPIAPILQSPAAKENPTDSPLSSEGKTLHLRKCDNKKTEIVAALAQIRNGLAEGKWTEDETLLAVPNLPDYAPTLLQAAADLGLSLDLSSGLKLAATPIGAAALALLKMGAGSPTPDDLLDLLASTPAGLDLPLPPDRLRSFLSQAKARGSHPKLWFKPLKEWNSSLPKPHSPHKALEAVSACVDLYEEFNEALRTPETPSQWLSNYEAALNRLGLPSRLPLNAGLSASAAAWGALAAVLDEAREWVEQVTHTEADPAHLQQLLKHSIQRCTFRPPSANRPSIAVVGILETRGIAPTHLWILGLNRGAFPLSYPKNPMLAPADWAQFQTVSPIAEARSILSSCMREASGQPNRTLRISFPEEDGGKLLLPSSPLLELIERFSTQSPVMQCGTHDVCEEGRSGRIRGGRGTTEDEVAHIGHQNRREEIRAVSAIGPFDGEVGSNVPDLAHVSPTRLERYIQCPARDWFSRGLGLSPNSERDEDAVPLYFGKLLHRILELYIQAEIEKRAPKDLKNRAILLHSIASKELERDDKQASLTEDGTDTLREKLLPGLLDDRPKGILAAWLEHEEGLLANREPIGVEIQLPPMEVGGVPLKGTIDRIDAIGPDGILITDYKSGAAPGLHKIKSGIALQSFLYGTAVGALHPNRTRVASVYREIGKANTISERSWMGDKSLVRETKKRARMVELTPELRDQLWDLCEHAVRSLQKGIHHPTVANPQDAGCDSCDFQRVCRRDDERTEHQTDHPLACGPLEAE